MRTLSLLLAPLFLIVGSSVASACLNDRETIITEREFKSNYEFKSNFEGKPDQPAPTLEVPSPPTSQLLAYGGIGAGCVLLLGATAVCFRKAGQ